MPPKKTKSVQPAAIAEKPATSVSKAKQRKTVEEKPAPKKEVGKKVKPDEVEEVEEEEEKKIDETEDVDSTSKSGGYNANGDFQGKLGNGKFGKDKIIISSWNVNGIRAVQKKHELEDYFSALKPDVLCINESKIDSSTFQKEHTIQSMIPSEYQQFWNFCKPPTKGYAGSAIFSKVAPINVIYDIGKKQHDSEGRTTTLEFDKFFLVACYVPNAGQGLKRLDYRVKEWDVDFEEFLTSLRAKKHVILCGDLNVCHHEIDIAKPKGNEKSAGFTKEERAKFTELLSHGWVDTFRQKYPTKVQYSYWNLRNGARKTNQGWRLDYFVVDEKFNNFVIDSTINNDIEGSDHCPIELTINNKTLKS